MSSWRSYMSTNVFFSSRDSGQSQELIPRGKGKLLDSAPSAFWLLRSLYAGANMSSAGAGGGSSKDCTDEQDCLLRRLPTDVEATDSLARRYFVGDRLRGDTQTAMHIRRPRCFGRFFGVR